MILMKKSFQASAVIGVYVRKEYSTDCSGINAQSFHIGKENITVTAGIKQEGVPEALDKTRKSPAGPEIGDIVYIVENNGESVRKVSFMGINA
jgi:hypothetical protein